MTVHQWRPAPTKGRAATVTLSGTADGPTPEQFAKGDFITGAATGVRRNLTATPLHQALRFGKITQEMFDAGDSFLILRTAAIKIRCGGGQRDSLDHEISGGGEASPEYEARILIRDTDCHRFMGRTGQGLHAAAGAFVVEGISRGKFDTRYLWWRNTHAALRALQEFFQGAK
jgi:hypothetical protein